MRNAEVHTPQGVSCGKALSLTARMGNAKAPSLHLEAPADPPARTTEGRARSIMVDQAPDRITDPCDYAACGRTAVAEADGWLFCSQHLTEHRYVTAGLDLPDLPRHLLPFDHGTEGGYKKHRRLGESPCASCMEGARVAAMVRNANWYAERWHRRESS